jgi:hypothetical protein
MACAEFLRDVVLPQPRARGQLPRDDAVGQYARNPGGVGL